MSDNIKTSKETDIIHPIGILDPNGINVNPLTNKPYSDNYKELAKKWSKFPAYENAQDTINKIRNNQVILVISSTGSGKTVLFPKFVLHVLDYKCKVAVTLPKQIIAKSAAEFATKTLDVTLGKEVGYKYKGSDKSGYSNETKLLYATDGTIVAQLLNDPKLLNFDAVVIDEAHERKVQIDFLLYLLKQTLIMRPEFKLIIMSATIDETLFRSYFSEFKYDNITVGGKSHYPIESIFLEKSLNDKEYLNVGIDVIKTIISKIGNNDKSKDILFFVTSITETFDMCEKVSQISDDGYCVEVYAGMDPVKQDIAQTKDSIIQFNKKIKIVISTNVAESSLTIDGIKYVIDSGYELFGYYDPEKDSKVLERRLITHAQAKQRMGRTGRTEPGVCYHLYTKNEFDNMEKFPQPTIRVSNLYGECMKLLNIPNIGTVEKLLDVLSKFIEPPREIYIKNGLRQLMQLGIIENEKITDIGKIISDTQLDPMQGLTLFAGYVFMCAKEIGAIISVIDVIKGNLSELFTLPLDIVGDENKKQLHYMTEKFNNSRKDLKSTYGDHLSIYKIIAKYQKIKDNEKQLSEWSYKYFIKKSILQKSLQSLRKIKNTIRKSFNNELIRMLYPTLNVKDILKYNLQYRIMASIAFGYRLHYAFYKQKTNKYDTSYATNIGIKKESYLLLNDKMSKQVIYNELSSINNKLEMNIVSSIPSKSMELCELLLNQ